MLERSLELSSQELLQKNSEMSAVYQAFPDLFFRTDAMERFWIIKHQVKRAYYPLRRRSSEQKSTDVFPVDIGKQFGDAIARVQEVNTLVSIEHSTSGQDGEYYYEARLLPLLDNQIIIIIRDITDRKRAEKALSDSEILYRTIFENTGTAMLIVEGNNTISLVNTQFMKQTGVSTEEIGGKIWTELSQFIVNDYLEQMKEYDRLRKRGLG